MIDQLNNPLEKEPVGKLLFRLAVPTVLAQLVNLLYNIVDRMYIGHIGSGESGALAGVGITFPVLILITAFTSLIGLGGAPRASIAMGKKDNKLAEKILGNCVTMLFLVSVVLTVVLSFLKEPILMAFGADSVSIAYATDYLEIYLIGTIFVQFAFGLNAFITSQGFAKMGMATILIGAVINIALDPIFIFTLDMGVRGAAIATIIAQAVSAAWVIHFMCGKKTLIRIKKENFKLSGSIVTSVLSLGIATFSMQLTECAVQLVFNKGMHKYGGTDYVAMMSILFSIMQLIWLPLQGIGQGAQPILSYNYGAKNIDRVKKTFKLLFISSITYSLVLIGIVELFPGMFIRMFTPNEELILIGSRGLRIFIAGVAIMGAQTSCQQTFLALGQAKISMFLALLRKAILLVPLALILPGVFHLGTDGLLLAETIADVLAVMTTTTLFMISSKRLFKVEE